MRHLLYLLLFLTTASFTFKDKIAQSKPGDFVVMEHSNSICILTIQALSENSAVLEEITAPSQKIASWQEWLNSNAPGATSWTRYEIDLQTCKLKSCYSYLHKKWIALDESEYFFAKLLSLPLTPLPESERKKIGPAPAAGEDDHRAFWAPPQVICGKKVSHPLFDVYKGVWPADQSLLSKCAVELYFDVKNPFPFWLEVKSPHYKVKMHTIDSGHNLKGKTTSSSSKA